MSRALSQAGRAALIASAVSIAVPVTAAFEGLRTHPYHDPAPRHTLTVCYGETKVKMRVYSPDECAVLLESHQRRDYAPAVLDCVPALGPRPEQFAAAIDASYNAGPGSFCKSRMAAAFNRGEWAAGCAAYLNWHTLPGTKAHGGLVRRRAAEAALCERGLLPPAPAAAPSPPAPPPLPAPIMPSEGVALAALLLAVAGLFLSLWSAVHKSANA